MIFKDVGSANELEMKYAGDWDNVLVTLIPADIALPHIHNLSITCTGELIPVAKTKPSRL
jgi:hypothetical protein